MALEDFPNHPIFKQLLEYVPLNDGIIIHDPEHGINANYARFLNDVLELRRTIREQIPDLLDSNGIVRNDGVYICTLAPASYEFFVAAFAIWAVGAALSPLATGIIPKEAVYLFEKSKAVLLIASSGQRDAAAEYQRCMKEETGNTIKTIGVDLTIPTPSTPPNYHIDERAVIPAARPMLLILTSGTTGPPKGVVRLVVPLNIRAMLKATNDDLTLCHRAIHWGFGIGPPISMLLSGLAIYVVGADPSPEMIWTALRQKKLTVAFATNLTFLRLMQYYNEHIANLEPDVVKEYTDGVRKLKYVACGGAVPMPSVGQFWKDMRGGHPITILYGTSEAGAALGTPPEGYDVTQRVIGKPLPGVQVKLSEGDHGEMLLKGPDLFVGYLNNEAATKAALDENGYYKTGDLVHIDENGNYIVDGRVKEDFVRSRTLKVGTLELEDKLSDLPYISEAAVIAVPDIEILHRVGVIARLKSGTTSDGTDQDGQPVNMLYKIRRDLTEMKVEQYKLPTLLRVLKDDEIIPRTTTDKVIRKKVLEIFFPQSADCRVEDLPKEVLAWDIKNDKKAGSTGLWDWAGAQD
ncbi:uncharacterized protein GIQ15_01308 [Arthroderma uncinatum]|uniref:uncharacterized protein n=1 Tax=Arthroderma uncinatum TaxID=74035 RepID=UPI00144A58E1|nr:uncharacterized protein GIQ15_01308 [Arthroderma uncinatum]KAF3491791.1 hypothetical protein GIQ15_01308 [Arthroderma uncinatum]